MDREARKDVLDSLASLWLLFLFLLACGSLLLGFDLLLQYLLTQGSCTAILICVVLALYLTMWSLKQIREQP